MYLGTGTAYMAAVSCVQKSLHPCMARIATRMARTFESLGPRLVELAGGTTHRTAVHTPSPSLSTRLATPFPSLCATAWAATEGQAPSPVPEALG